LRVEACLSRQYCELYNYPLHRRKHYITVRSL